MSASDTLYETRAWLIDPASPTTALVIAGTGGNLGGGGQRLTSRVTSGGPRTYGDGRVRNVVGANTVSTYSLALIRCTQANLAQLESWASSGTLLLFRDIYGQRDYGNIFGLSEYAEPHTVATALPGGSIYLSPNGPFFDIAFQFNVATVPVGT